MFKEGFFNLNLKLRIHLVVIEKKQTLHEQKSKKIYNKIYFR